MRVKLQPSAADMDTEITGRAMPQFSFKSSDRIAMGAATPVCRRMKNMRSNN